MSGASEPSSISTKLQQIAELAQRSPSMVLTSLNHHLDLTWLKEAFARTRKDGATGVDQQSAAEYAAHLEQNLADLLERAKSGRYRAPPVRRVHIPKGDGSTRPLGIPTVEDKVLQRAIVMLLEPIFEQDFLDCSFGFRPKKSAHQLLESFWKQAMDLGGGFVLEVDLRRFFDTVDHAVLMETLRQRVSDGVVLRLIGKWLNAGVMEEGSVTYPQRGTPQGGVISPLLANVLLHEVIDVWFERMVKPRLHGAAQLFRYADDIVILFANEDDARRVHEVLPKRLAKAGLALHPDKTRLVDFRHPQARASARDETDRHDGPGSFALLGFTHVWVFTHKRRWTIRRATAKDRFTRALKAIADFCRKSRHWRVAEQHARLCAKLLGHYAYFGITGNLRRLSAFRDLVRRAWKRGLDQRSGAPLTWARFATLLQRYPLPAPRIVHSYVSCSAHP